MTRDEVKKLFKFIKLVYQNFEVTSEKVDAWYQLLREFDYEQVMANAEKHALSNTYPPTIADLVKQETKTNGRYVPDDFTLDYSAGEDR